MTERALAIDTGQTLALLGRFLLLVVARLADLGYSGRPTLSGFRARRAIDGGAVIGWLADHLPQPATNGGLR
jgi:hypothetical protein